MKQYWHKTPEAYAELEGKSVDLEAWHEQRKVRKPKNELDAPLEREFIVIPGHRHNHSFIANQKDIVKGLSGSKLNNIRWNNIVIGRKFLLDLVRELQGTVRISAKDSKVLAPERIDRYHNPLRDDIAQQTKGYLLVRSGRSQSRICNGAHVKTFRGFDNKVVNEPKLPDIEFGIATIRLKGQRDGRVYNQRLG